MEKRTKSLDEQAEAFLREKKFGDAGKCYELAAEQVDNKKQKADLLKKAAGVYNEVRMTDDAVRCLTHASGFLEKTEKAECLMDCFKVLILAIAGYEYDCGFEWRGATDGSHSDDHESYQKSMQDYQENAEKIVRDALSVEGVDRAEILEQARGELRKRKDDGGWGASRCAVIIENVARATAGVPHEKIGI
jgi:hypothetical protein